MAKRNFMETPEQRDRAKYYSKKRTRQVSDLPLIQNQMVEEQFIETPEPVEQEPVFEYATPNMPSAQEIAATYDRGTAGIWSGVVDNITGAIMNVTQDVYAFNAQRKIEQRKFTLEEYRADPTEMNSVKEKIENNYDARSRGEAVFQLDIPEAMRTERNMGIVRLGKQIYIQNNGSEELQSAIQEELSARGITDSYDTLSPRQQADIMETIFIQSDSLLFGDAIREDRKQQWLDITATVDSKDFAKMSEELEKYRESLNQQILLIDGVADQETADTVLRSIMEAPTLDSDIVLKSVGGNLSLLEGATTEKGTPVFDIQKDDEGNLVSIGFNGSPEQYLADENSKVLASVVLGTVLRSGFPNNSIENIPQSIMEGARSLAQGDDDSPFALASLVFLSSFNNESIEGLVGRSRELGGLGLDVTNQARLLTFLTLHKNLGSEEPGKNMDVQRTLNTFDEIFNPQAFRGYYSSFSSASADPDTISKRNAITELFRDEMGLAEGEYDPLAFDFNIEEDPSLASLMITFYAIDQRNNLSETVKEQLKQSLYNNAKVVPIFREIDEKVKLVDVQLRNSTDFAILGKGVRSFDDRINYEFAATQNHRSDLEDVDIVLDNLSPNTYRGFDRDELEEAMMIGLEKVRQREIRHLELVKEKKVDKNKYRISVKGFNEGIFLMTPSVQEELFEKNPETIENLLANFDELIGGNKVTNISYAPSTDISRRQRNNANYDSSSFGYGIESITYKGEVYDVSDSFASRNRSGMVFPSVYANLLLDENGNPKEHVLPASPLEDPFSFWSIITGTAAADDLQRQLQGDLSLPDIDPSTPVSSPDPDAQRDIEFYLTSPGATTALAYELYNSIKEKIEKLDFVAKNATSMIASVFGTVYDSVTTRAELISRVSEEVRKLVDEDPNQFSNLEKSIVFDISNAFLRSLGDVVKIPKTAAEGLSRLPGDVVEAVEEAAPKLRRLPEDVAEGLRKLPGDIIKGVRNTYIDLAKRFGRSSNKQYVNQRLDEINEDEELQKHLVEKISPDILEISNEQITKMDNMLVSNFDELELKEKNRQEQKDYNQFEFYIEQKLTRSPFLSVDDKVDIFEMIETRPQFISLYNRVKSRQTEQPTFLDLYENLLEMRSLTLMENN